MTLYPGFKSKTVHMTGSALETISSGTVVTNMAFVNHTGATVAFSGTALDSTKDTEEFVVTAITGFTVAFPETFYCAGGMKFTAPAGTKISYRYGTTR